MQRLFQAIFPVFWCSRRSLFDLLSPDNLHPCLKMAVFFEFLSLRSKPLNCFPRSDRLLPCSSGLGACPASHPIAQKSRASGTPGLALIPLYFCRFAPNRLNCFPRSGSTVALQQRARRVPGLPPHRAKITRVGDSGPALIPSIRVISFTLRMAVYHPASSSWIQQLL
jgi:hypothetical protein